MSPDKIREPNLLLRAMLLLVLLAGLSVAAACRSVASQSTKTRSVLDSQLTRRSDSTLPPPSKRQFIEASLLKLRETSPDVREAGSVTVPVYFHILTSTDGKQGSVSCETVQKQIEVLNKAFAGNDHPGEGVATPFRFVFAGMDITAKDEWFNMRFRDVPTSAEIDAKKELNRGGSSTLNIYTVSPAETLYGWNRWPWDYADGADGVVLRYTTLPGGSEYHYEEGDTATHEVGHWLGLFHTFEGGCDLPGDSVDDTPPQRVATINCPDSAETCPGGENDQVHNFMNFTWDRCMYKFTAGQSKRMDAIHLLYRTEANADTSRDSGR